jgi:Bacteriophage lambda head decoration protein D
MSTPTFTENRRFSHTVKAELWPELGYTRAVVTYNGTAGSLIIGQTLGKVTANGKYKVALQAAVDGSQTVDAILLEDKTVTLNTDATMLVLLKGPAVVSKAALTIDASYTAGALLNGVYTTLEAKGIQVNDAA